MTAIMSPLLKNLLMRLLLLTQCIFFKIDPKDKSILLDREDIGTDDDPNLSIDQLLTHEKPNEQQYRQIKVLDKRLMEQRYEITFIDLSDKPFDIPKELSKLVNESSPSSSITRLFVANNTSCRDILEHKFEEADARLYTIFVCKEDEPGEFALIYDKVHKMQFQSIEKPFKKADAWNATRLSTGLFKKILIDDRYWLVEHGFCRDKFTYRRQFRPMLRENLPDPTQTHGDQSNTFLLSVCTFLILLFSTFLTLTFFN